MSDKPKKRRKLKEAQAVETHPDAWDRFEAATQKMVLPKERKPNAQQGEEPETKKPAD